METESDRWSQRATLSLLDEYYRQTGFLYRERIWPSIGERHDASDSVRFVSGVSWERQEGNDNSFPESEGDSHALFAQAEIAYGEAIDLVLGVRHDDYDFSGSKTTWRANGLWRRATVSLLGQHMEQLSEPRTFPPVFDFKFRIGKPWPRKPEEAKAGKSVRCILGHGNYRAGVTCFKNDIENLIVWTPARIRWHYENRDIAENYESKPTWL